MICKVSWPDTVVMDIDESQLLDEGRAGDPNTVQMVAIDESGNKPLRIHDPLLNAINPRAHLVVYHPLGKVQPYALKLR